MQHPADAVVSLNDLPETELLRLLSQRHAPAFRAVIGRNNRRLYRIARSILRDDAEAEDVVQEAYIRAFCALDRFKAGSSLSTWLTRIAVNEALGRLRRRRHSMIESGDRQEDGGEMERKDRIIPFPLARTAAALVDPEQAAARAEIRRLVETAIEQLPAPFRIVFILREVEQMSIAETAACLDLPADTVKTRLHRAKQRLRALLEEQLASALSDTFPFGGLRCAQMADRVLERLGISAAGPRPPPP